VRKRAAAVGRAHSLSARRKSCHRFVKIVHVPRAYLKPSTTSRRLSAEQACTDGKPELRERAFCGPMCTRPRNSGKLCATATPVPHCCPSMNSITRSLLGYCTSRHLSSCRGPFRKFFFLLKLSAEGMQDIWHGLVYRSVALCYVLPCEAALDNICDARIPRVGEKLASASLAHSQERTLLLRSVLCRHAVWLIRPSLQHRNSSDFEVFIIIFADRTYCWRTHHDVLR
jgi:hypothetical protein